MGKKQVFEAVEGCRSYEQIELHNKVLCDTNAELQVEIDRLKETIKVLSCLIQDLAK